MRDCDFLFSCIFRDSINPYFDEYSDLIRSNLPRYGSLNTSRKYDDVPELLNSAHNHIAKYSKTYDDSDAKKTIMLVHPFFLPLSQMDLIKSSDMRLEVYVYLSDLMDLLDSVSHNPDFRVVALESLYHYCVSSWLLELGLIGGVVLTWDNLGCPLRETELEKFGGDAIYFAGMYNGSHSRRRCLNGAIDVMARYNSPENLFGVSDLILNSPCDVDKSLKSDDVDGIYPYNLIGLNDFVDTCL